MTRGAAFLLGLRSVAPMLLGVAPFGVLYGVVALQSGIPPLPALAISSIVFAGSAQFLLAQLVGAGAPALLATGAVGLVNLRHALYSASVAPLLAHLPRRWKLLLAYLLTDEVATGIGRTGAMPRRFLILRPVMAPQRTDTGYCSARALGSGRAGRPRHWSGCCSGHGCRPTRDSISPCR
mgnify:CR=1 FL=1